MPRVSVQRIVLAVIVVIVLGILVPPFINVNRYRGRIAESMSNAVGRNVTIGSVELRLLPQPGFYLENVGIADDPAISAEPMLHAEEVRADLRLRSLWHGRLELAKLKLTYPSLNLVRGANGQWNFESILWRASRTQVAPTSAPAEARKRFPYIEVDTGRVNFKYGLEKSVFSLTDTDLALWSPAENEWRVRIEARPVRTDVNITDTGVIRGEVNFRRAEMLRDTPLQGRMVWEQGQLGQLTKLVYGRDRGWRGGLELSGEMSGTFSELHFSTNASVRDFRRFDISGGGLLDLHARCSGIATLPRYALDGFACALPAGRGTLKVGGSLGPSASTYDIAVLAEAVPIDNVVAFVKHAKRGVPNDITGTGVVNATATFRRNGPDAASRVWTGEGKIEDAALKSEVLDAPLVLGDIGLRVRTPADEAAAKPASGSIRNARQPSTRVGIPDQFLTVSQFALDLRGAKPATVTASLGTQGYNLGIEGPARVERLVAVARALGISAPSINLTGSADVALAVTGQWRGLPQPAVAGSATLSDVTAEVPGIAAPVKVATANAGFSGVQFRLTKMNGSAGVLRFTGDALVPRHCEEDAPCGPELNLSFDELAAETIDSLVNPARKQRPWYRLFGRRDSESVLARTTAVGRVSARRIAVGKLAGTNAFAAFRLQNGQLMVTQFRADLLGGTHAGDWTADFKGKAPVFNGTGALTRVNVEQLASLAGQPLGSGTLNGRYTVKMQGLNAPEFADSMDLNATFDWNKGTIRTFSLDGRSPLRLAGFSGTLRFANGKLEISQSRMQTPSGIYTVSGTASSSYNLELQLTDASGSAYKVTGPLQKPEVVAVREPRSTEASLAR